MNSSFDADIEDEIEKLEGTSTTSASDASRLKDLKDELTKIMKKKEEYVTEHPEHRKLVFKGKKQQHDSTQEDAPKPELKSRKLFNKHGLPRHPERSVYYDPVMNPYGVPPPGMPYIERRKFSVSHLRTEFVPTTITALLPDEVDSDEPGMCTFQRLPVSRSC